MFHPVPLFGPVGPEVLIIIAIVILLFGASRIPKLANAAGQSFGSFKKGREEVEEELTEAQADLDESPAERESDVTDEQVTAKNNS